MNMLFSLFLFFFQFVELLGSMVYGFSQFWKVSPIFLQIVFNLISFENSNYLHISHLMLSQNAVNFSFAKSYLYLGFPGRSVVTNLTAIAGDTGSFPALGRSPGKGNDNPLQYSCLGNPMDRGAW